jgi:hypothetical protein
VVEAVDHNLGAVGIAVRETDAGGGGDDVDAFRRVAELDDGVRLDEVVGCEAEGAEAEVIEGGDKARLVVGIETSRSLV